MDRKTFLSMAPLAGLMTLGNCGTSGNDEQQSGDRDYYELRSYLVESEDQVTGLRNFLKDAAIPALNRIGVEPVGVFQPEDSISPVYVLLRYRSLETLATATQRLLGDDTYLNDGAGFLDASPEAPAYTRIESSLLVAFTGIPQMETPVGGNDRVFQLRTYESTSVKRGQKKIEMFNNGELPIFRKTGLNPVFFGETLVGAKIPNLTYMVAFENREEQEASWARFQSDPEWLTLRSLPEYAGIVSNITNIILNPLDCSQI